MEDERIFHSRLHLAMLSPVLERDRQRTRELAGVSVMAITRSLVLLAKINGASGQPLQVVADAQGRIGRVPNGDGAADAKKPAT
jgi:hypothetical protein